MPGAGLFTAVAVPWDDACPHPNRHPRSDFRITRFFDRTGRIP
jgi:hypothetical protein